LIIYNDEKSKIRNPTYIYLALAGPEWRMILAVSYETMGWGNNYSMYYNLLHNRAQI